MNGTPDSELRGERSWPALLDVAPESDGIDLAAVRRYRQERVRAEMAARGIGAVILSDSVNIRYASGSRNMQVFTSRNAPSRYFVLTADRSILFEFTGCEHLADGLDPIDEVRPALTASYVAAGPDSGERERTWAAQMSQLLRQLLGPGRHRVGIERMNAGAAIALQAHGHVLVDAQAPVERARAIKSPGEIQCIRASVRMTERAVADMRDALAPGLTENELWSVLHKSVIAGNGEYCETRLLSSGPTDQPVVPGIGVEGDPAQRTGSTRYRCRRLPRLLHRLLTDIPCRTRRARARTAADVPLGPRPSHPQPRPHPPGREVPRVRPAGLGDPRALPPQSLLPVVLPAK